VGEGRSPKGKQGGRRGMAEGSGETGEVVACRGIVEGAEVAEVVEVVEHKL
jgi:hypothetical protein